MLVYVHVLVLVLGATRIPQASDVCSKIWRHEHVHVHEYEYVRDPT